MRHISLLRCYLSGPIWLIFRGAIVSAQAGPVPTTPTAPAKLDFGGGPAVVVTADVRDGAAVLHAARLDVKLPINAVETVQTENVRLRGGAVVGVVRLSAAAQKAAVLLVKRRPDAAPEWLWTGRLDLHGDPGERRADALEIGDRDGDGQPDVVVGSYDEQVRVCGAERTLVAPRAVDPRSLSLRSVLLNREQQRPLRSQLVASASPPTDPGGTPFTPPPVLRSLRAVGASSAADGSHGPSALTDGDLTSEWIEGRGLGGRFEFATASWAAPNRAIHALAVVPAAPSSGTSSRARVRALSILGPQGERFTVSLPSDARAGERYWITPPQPLAWSCLTVSLDDVSAEPLTAQTHAGLAEIEAYTALDRAEGMHTLISELAEPGARGDDATTQLQQARGDVTAALTEAWPSLPQVGKRRALRLLFQTTSTPDPRSRELLRSALRDSDLELNNEALKLAAERVSFGHELLEELAHSATSQGDRAAQVLAHSGAHDAFAKLLAVLVEPAASERPALRDAVATAFRNASPDARAPARAWLTSGAEGKPVEARAALALALATLPEATELVNELVETSRADAHEFKEQWRLVVALRELAQSAQSPQLTEAKTPTPSTSHAGLDAWLREQSEQAETWMLRAAALEALAARSPIQAQAAAKRALKDDYPRVRAAAVGLLAPRASELPLLEESAQEDPWFLVRQAALLSLPDSPKARVWFSKALGDRTPAVRASAIRALSRVGAAEVWPQIKPLLEKADEYPEVIAEGITFARALCITDSVPSLRAVVLRGLAPDAWSADQDLALSALEALSTFGGASAAWARDHAVGPFVPKPVQLAAAAAAARGPSCKRQLPP